MQVENNCAENAPVNFEAPAANEECTREESTPDWEKEYAQLQQKYAELQQKSILEKVSYETGCTDPEYLEFRARRQGITVSDPDSLRRFARELAAVAPGCFNARITPGSSAGNSGAVTSPAGNQREGFSGDRIGMIALSIDCAPDALAR